MSGSSFSDFGDDYSFSGMPMWPLQIHRLYLFQDIFDASGSLLPYYGSYERKNDEFQCKADEQVYREIELGFQQDI